MKRVGSSKKAEKTHIDYLKKLHREMPTEEAEELPAAKPHARKEGTSRPIRQFKVLCDDNTVIWEPLNDRDHAAEVIKEWTQLPQSDKDKVQALSPSQLLDMHEKLPTDLTVVKVERRQVNAKVNLMHDISRSDDERAIRNVCEQMGIKKGGSAGSSEQPSMRDIQSC